jgi:hypothetical protein
MRLLSSVLTIFLCDFIITVSAFGGIFGCSWCSFFYLACTGGLHNSLLWQALSVLLVLSSMALLLAPSRVQACRNDDQEFFGNVALLLMPPQTKQRRTEVCITDSPSRNKPTNQPTITDNEVLHLPSRTENDCSFIYEDY